MIRQQLETRETPLLYCMLGDATDDIEHYNKGPYSYYIHMICALCPPHPPSFLSNEAIAVFPIFMDVI